MNREQFEQAVQELSTNPEALRPSDVVLFSEPLRSALNGAVRRGRRSLAGLAGELGLELDQARQIIDLLVQRQLLQLSYPTSPTEILYETRVTASRPPMARLRRDLWKKIDE